MRIDREREQKFLRWTKNIFVLFLVLMFWYLTDFTFFEGFGISCLIIAGNLLFQDDELTDEDFKKLEDEINNQK